MENRTDQTNGGQACCSGCSIEIGVADLGATRLRLEVYRQGGLAPGLAPLTVENESLGLTDEDGHRITLIEMSVQQ